MESNFNTLTTDALFPLVLLDFTIVLNLKEFQAHSVFFLLVIIKAFKRGKKHTLLSTWRNVLSLSAYMTNKGTG